MPSETQSDTIIGMYHVIEVKPDRLETALNRLDRAGFEITAVTASGASTMLSGGGRATMFTIIAKGNGTLPDLWRP